MNSVPQEIADQIVLYIYEDSLKKLEAQRRREELYGLPQRPTYWTISLQHLRCTSRSFRGAVDRVLFNEFKIEKLSLWSLVRTKYLLESPSISSSIHAYSLSPKVCLVRPVVERNEWGYYGEFSGGCGSSEPKYSFLQSIHSMRQEVAKHYDEQLRLMGIDGWWKDWLWFGLKRLLRGSNASPQTTNLKTLPYFSSVPRLTNLRKLNIGYSIPQSGQENRIHYLIKNDMSAGLATILRDAPPRLESLVIGFPTLTDLHNLIRFANQGMSMSHLPQVKFLEITLTQETLSHRGQAIDKEHKVHGHFTGGRPIADMLQLFPNIERLKLVYGQEFRDAILVLQDFHPPAMKSLEWLHLEAFGMDPAVLMTMVNTQIEPDRTHSLSINTVGIALFNKGPSWSDLANAMSHRRCFSQKSGHESQLRGHLRYLDRQLCTDKVLSGLMVQEEKLLHDLNDEEEKQLKKVVPTFQPASLWSW